MKRRGVETPVGALWIEERDGAVAAVGWGDAGADDSPLLVEATTQVADYFAGQRRGFDLPLALGDGFRRRFLEALIAIPFGETRTYGDLAAELDVSAQAVGQACGANPIPVIVPCHRVLGATGLGGFSGGTGVETKVALLRHEGAAALLI